MNYHPNRKRRRFILGPILIALVYIAFQYFSAETYTNPDTGETVRVALSTDEEEALGLQSFRQVLSQSQVLREGPEVETVQRVVSRLVRSIDNKFPEFNWKVSVIDSDQINAFCLPGGKIAVYTGIIPVAQNDAGLATVIGHEIAHATARHGSQRLLKQKMMQTAMMGVSTAMNDVSPQQRQTILGLLGAGVNYGLIMPFSRDHELEADKLGLHYMVAAGYDPNESVKFWQRMDRVKDSAKQPPAWLSTHPANEKRIRELRKEIALLEG